MNLKTIYSIQ